MPNYEVECVDRETGDSVVLVFDAADDRTARRYANEDGYIVGTVRLQEAGAARLPMSTFRPTFQTHLTPKIARATATGAIVLAVIMPMVTIAGVLIPAPDPTSTEVLIRATIAGFVSLLFFSLFALYARLFAEIVSILFDIYRLLRELHSTFHR